MMGGRISKSWPLVLALSVAAPGFASGAWQGPPGRPSFGGGFAGGFDFLGVHDAFEGRLVKGAPYQAEAVTEFVQVLSDGNRVVRRTSVSVARDGNGRTRREQALTAIGPLVHADGEARLVFIHDPVAGVSYVLDPDRHEARKLERPPSAGRFPSGDHTRSGHEDHGAPFAGADRWAERRGPETQTESLGTQTQEGFEAEGTRTTATIPAGAFGNEKPIQVVSERWYSPELKVVVMSRTHDPRFGDTTFRLADIRRGEPDKSLFEVPAGYTVVSGRPEGPFGARGRDAHRGGRKEQ
jgi:hypothetical protein